MHASPKLDLISMPRAAQQLINDLLHRHLAPLLQLHIDVNQQCGRS
jgi:hypothetical protein